MRRGTLTVSQAEAKSLYEATKGSDNYPQLTERLTAAIAEGDSTATKVFMSEEEAEYLLDSLDPGSVARDKVSAFLTQLRSVG